MRLLLALCVLCAGCWLTKPPPISPTVPDGGFADASAGTTFRDCSERTLHDAWVGLLPAIETGFATGNLQGALAAVGIDIALPGVIEEVTCAAHYLVDRITHSEKVAPDRVEETKLANAQAWLRAHPVAP